MLKLLIVPLFSSSLAVLTNCVLLYLDRRQDRRWTKEEPLFVKVKKIDKEDDK